MKRIRALTTAICATAFVGVSLSAKSLSLNDLAHVSTLQHRHFDRGTFRTSTEAGDSDAIRLYMVVEGNNIYNLLGNTLNSQKAGDGSIAVPFLDDSASSLRTMWGRKVHSVRIGITVDHLTVDRAKPIFAQVSIENHSTEPFELHYGCGPNMNLALPEITNSFGLRVQERFTIGQDYCYWTGSFSIAAKTTSRFIFNIRDLYNIDKTGKYRVAMKFPRDGDNVISQARGISSGTVTFLVE